MAQAVGFSRALAAVRRTVAARRDAKRRARAVRIPPCNPSKVFCKNKKAAPRKVLLLAQTVGFEPTWHCCQIDFESSTSRYSSYISLFRFALERLFSVLTLVFDILTYFVLYVARGCLGNIWATIVFRATLFGTTQGKLKICTEFEDLAIFQSKSFFFYGGFYREKYKFCCRKWRFYPQNARVFCCAE